MGLLEQVPGDGSRRCEVSCLLGGCSLSKLALEPVNANVCRVLTHTGLHVGNLKLIGGVWKFKAIGYDTSRQVVPGGGPLTHQHNQAFVMLDEAEINRVLV